MKNLKLITTVFLTTLLTLTSCQDEIDNETGENPNTNTNAANSQTATNLKRSSMYDGSFDDFLDGVSCSSILLPVTATVNDTEITIVSQTDYQQVLDILAEFNTDDDTVVLQFPFTVALSNYTEIVVTNQTEYDAIIDACEEAEATAQDAITCVDVNFPVTILTYNINAEQTGSVVIESEEQLFNYINNFEEDELFSVNYPITVTGAGGNTVSISSDADLQSSVEDCLDQENAEEEAEENAEALEQILVDGIFQVETFINSGVDTASDYAEFTIDFANDLSLVAQNTVNTTVENIEGTYQVTTQTQVFLNLNFTSNASFSLLNQNWEVTSFNNTTISLQSTTNAAVTLVLEQI